MASKTYVLFRHKAKSQLRVSMDQVKSAHQFALSSGRWTGQALLAHYLIAHRRTYGINQRLDNCQLAQKSSDLAWLAHDYRGLAPKIIDTIFSSKRLTWLSDRWFVLTSPDKVARWVLPVVEHESKQRQPGEQSEWSLTPDSGQPTMTAKPPAAESWVDQL